MLSDRLHPTSQHLARVYQLRLDFEILNVRDALAVLAKPYKQLRGIDLRARFLQPDGLLRRNRRRGCAEEKFEQSHVVYGGEELPHIAFHRIYRPRPIEGCLAQERSKSPYRHVRSFPDPAGVAVENKPPLEQRLDDVDDSLMNNSVLHSGLVDYPLLRVVDGERFISAVPVGSGKEFIAYGEKIVFEAAFEYHDVFPAAFALAKTLPCQK